MKKSKIIVSLFLCALMICSMVFSAYAAYDGKHEKEYIFTSGSPSYKLDYSVEGSNVIVTLGVENAEGLEGVDFSFDYDEDILSFVDYDCLMDRKTLLLFDYVSTSNMGGFAFRDSLLKESCDIGSYKFEINDKTFKGATTITVTPHSSFPFELRSDSISVSLSGSDYESEVECDVDCDGSVTAQDARLTLRAALGLETLSYAQEKTADMDKDSFITSADARLILRKALRIGDPTATESPIPTTPSTTSTTVPTTSPATSSSSLPPLDSDFTYLAGSDFRAVRRKYSSARALGGSVINSIVSDQFYVFTYVVYEIGSYQFKVKTLHNITTGETIDEPYDHFENLKNHAWGGMHIYYMQWQTIILEWEYEALDCILDIWETGSHTGFSEYVGAEVLNM